MTEAHGIEWRDFQDGFISGLHGEDPRACPYPKMSAEWVTWQKWHGWGNEIGNAVEQVDCGVIEAKPSPS